MRSRRAQPKARQFLIGSDPGKAFVDNHIRTSKYTKINFLPKAIILQFRRLANIYFLITAVLQCINEISSLTPVSAIAPFIIVIVLSIIREFVEDVPRQKSDTKVNNSQAIVLDKTGETKEIAWKNMKVGELVLVKDGEEFPADLVLLKSSNDNNAAFIETANLDGEKNLKPKFALQETAAFFEGQIIKNSGLFRCAISAQPPDPNLYKFEGAFIDEQGFKTAVIPKQLLLRGAKLKNVEWIIGAAVYTGHDTKVMRNAEQSKTKQSRVEHQMNRLILAILLVQLILCAVAAIGNRIFNGLHYYNYIYFDDTHGKDLEAFFNFLSYFLLTNTMIPISLIVTIEIVKFIQALFIQADEDLYSIKKDKGTKAFCSSINEELGLVDYIFSDKTGTLTSNEMVFKNFVIGREVYGEDQVMAQSSQVFSEKVSELPAADQEESVCINEKFADERLQNVLNSAGSYPINYEIRSTNGAQAIALKTHKDLVFEFLQSVAVNHECIVEKDKDGNILFQGQSQDEVRLVETASDAGFKYLGGTLDKMRVQVPGEEKEFKVLQGFEFTSDRKRMSTLVRDGTTIKLYTKGADNVIMERLKKGVNQPYVEFVNGKLEEFSKRGYRTLVFAMKIVSEDEYKMLKESLDDVAGSEGREELIEKIADLFERDLYLTGCTAVEDKLQDNVPRVIHDFLQANIKVWMLTGDKLETAENIAYSCRLITGDMSVMRCHGKSKEEVQAKLTENKEVYDMCVQENRKKALIVEGEALTHITADSQMLEVFVSIVLYCDAVVCCRAAPKQKAEMVRIVKDRTGKITLGIGDGANDVNMIQAANIGIGLYGHEGVQAVQASDFAIPEFQTLWKLLLVHGKWSYIRISEMILYFFYKNMLFTLPQFYFAFINGFSAQTFYDDYYVTLYNLIFTAFPLGVKAVLEKDVDYRIRLPRNQITKKKAYYEDPKIKALTPSLYAENKAHPSFNSRNFAYWVAKGALMAVLVFVWAIETFADQIINSSGKTSSHWACSIAAYTAIIFIVSIKLGSYTRYWNGIFAGSMLILTFALYFAFNFAHDAFRSVNSYQTILIDYESVIFYLNVLFFVGMELGFDIAVQTIYKQYRPTSADRLRQSQRYHNKAHQHLSKNVAPAVELISVNKVPIRILENKPPGHIIDIAEPQTLSSNFASRLQRDE